MSSFSSSINEFVSRLRGPARLSRYAVNFAKFNAEVNRRLSLSCESIVVPGKTIASVPFRIYGPKMEMPYEMMYSNEFQMTFRVSDDVLERLAFEEWSGRVVSDRRHDVRFVRDYASDVIITQLDMDDNPIVEYTITEAYPKTVGDVEFGYDKTDQYMLLPISLAFVEMKITSWIEPTGISGRIVDLPKIE